MNLRYGHWSWISWSWVMRIDHGSHEVELWGLIMDLIKLSYKDFWYISWSWVMRCEHRSHVVVLLELIIDLMKLSYEDWSWISWSWVIRLTMDLMKFSYEKWSWISWCHFKRIDQWSHEVMSWGLIIYLSVVTSIFHRCHEVELSRWIINVKKLSYKDWSWMSWSWVMRIVHGSQEVEL